MRYLKRIQGEQAAEASVATPEEGTATRPKLALKKLEKEGAADVR